MVELYKEKANASVQDVANELTTWIDRVGNSAADEAAKAALVAHIVSKDTDTPFGRMDMVVTMAANEVGYRAALPKVRNEARDTLRRQSKQVQPRPDLPGWDGLAGLWRCAWCSVLNNSAVVLESWVCRGTLFLATFAVTGGVETWSCAHCAEGSPLGARVCWWLPARATSAHGPAIPFARLFLRPKRIVLSLSPLVSVLSLCHLTPRWGQVLIHWRDPLLDVLRGKTFAKKGQWMLLLQGSLASGPFASPERHEVANQHRLIWEAVAADGLTRSGFLAPH